jgi:hypothetical protein
VTIVGPVLDQPGAERAAVSAAGGAPSPLGPELAAQSGRGRAGLNGRAADEAARV